MLIRIGAGNICPPGGQFRHKSHEYKRHLGENCIEVLGHACGSVCALCCMLADTRERRAREESKRGEKEAAGEGRETDRHTHTHRERERERERKCVFFVICDLWFVICVLCFVFCVLCFVE